MTSFTITWECPEGHANSVDVYFSDSTDPDGVISDPGMARANPCRVCDGVGFCEANWTKNRPTKATPLTQAPTMATTTAILAKAAKDIAAIMKKAEADVKALEAKATKATPVAAKATKAAPAATKAKGKGASASKSASSSSDDEKDLATKVRDAVEAAAKKSKAKVPSQSYYNVVTGKTCVRRGQAKTDNVFYSKDDLHICAATGAKEAAKALKELGMTKAHLVVDEEKKAKAPTKKSPAKDAEAASADADDADADDADADDAAVSDDADADDAAVSDDE